MSTMNIYDLTDTWNAGGTTFNAIKMNVTDTASAAGSLLMDLQVGGVSQFSVTKGGRITAQTLTIGLGGQTAVASNTALGFEALHSASLTGANNVGVGYQALVSNTTGSFNSAMGVSALGSNTTGTANNAMGVSALFSNTAGGFNSAMGFQALVSNTTGSYNNAVGVSALGSNTTGSNNNAVGLNALFSNTAGTNNSAMGASASNNNITGNDNSAVGYGALGSNNSNNNAAIGFEAGRTLSGANNTLAGYRAGYGFTRGVATLGAITGGSGYTDGSYTGVTLTRASGSYFWTAPTANITVSGGAVTAVTIATAGAGFTDTTIVLSAAAANIGGTGSGFSVVVSTLTGAASADNTLLGYQAGDNLTEGSGNIIIGSGADADSATGSNQINIGDRFFHDRIRLLERTSDPTKPTEGNCIVWMSDGTGLGDDGDVMIGSTAGGVTNYAILFDHSAGTLWP